MQQEQRNRRMQPPETVEANMPVAPVKVNAPEAEFERRSFQVQHRAVSENGKMTIGGMAALYNKYTDMGWYLEVILPGFFDEVKMDRCACLKNHDTNIVLGRTKNSTLEIRVTTEGLDYTAVLPDTEPAKTAYTEVQGGYIYESSFGFTVSKASWSEVDRSLLEGSVPKEVLDKHAYEGKVYVRELVKCRELFDVSPVTFAQYEDTTVAKRSFQAAGMAKPEPLAVAEETPKTDTRNFLIMAAEARARLYGHLNK